MANTKSAKKRILAAQKRQQEIDPSARSKDGIKSCNQRACKHRFQERLSQEL